MKSNYIFQSLTDGFISAPGSFLFSLRNNYDIDPFKCPLRGQNDELAMLRSNSGPTFGLTDMKIADNAGSSTESYIRPGYTYQAPPGYTLLGGSAYFTPSEVEVLYLI